MAKFEITDSVTGSKYEFTGNREPTQTEVEDYLQGTITTGKSSTIEKFERATLGDEAYKDLENPVARGLQTAVQAPYQFITRQMSRPTSAIKALTAGENPVKGWVNPEEYNYPSAQIIPTEAWGIKPGSEEDFQVRFLAGFAADLGSLHLIFGALPKVGVEKYKGAQKVEFDKFKDVLRSEFQKAGMGEASASVSAELTGTSIMENARMTQKTPWNIVKSTEILKNNPGKLADIIKKSAGLNKANVDKLGFTNWAEKAGEELKSYEGWLQAREPTQRPNLNVPLHPAPAESIDYTKPFKLVYPNVPKTVINTLPDEIISKPTEEEYTKTLSKFPQKIVDQKSMEEVGNAMAAEMGIKIPIQWTYKLHDKKYVSGVASIGTAPTQEQGHRIMVRIPRESPSLEDIKGFKNSRIKGSRGERSGSELQPTQGKIKKVMIHELSHILTPGDHHSSIFWDEVDYHEGATLIKRELRKRQVSTPTEGKVEAPKIDKLGVPVVQSKSYAGYKVPRGILVYSAQGEPITTFESTEAAQRWITSAENETQNLVLIEKPKAKPETILTLETLIDTPELASEVLANPTGHSPEVVDMARQIEADARDTTPALPVEKVKEMSEGGEAIPPKVEDVQKPFVPVIEESTTGLYTSDQMYNVTYQKATGQAATTTIRGGFLNTMQKTLDGGKNAVDPFGHLVIKIVDAYPIKGDSGQFLMPEWVELEDALTNLGGMIEVGKEKYLGYIKKIAIPEKVDNPLFKPIYNAVQHGVDYRTELTITGLKLLDAKFILSLPETQKAALSGVIKLGNELHKEYTPEELKATFNFNDNQIKAYNNLRRLYDYSINETIKAKQLSAEYDSLKPEDKAQFDKMVEETRKGLKGYVSQERLGSGEKPWAVFKPGLPGEKPEFFAVFTDKAEALKNAQALGSVDYMYLRKNIINKVTNRLSLADLEELLDSADISNTPEIQTLRDEIKKRGALHHEVRRQNIPGYEWNLGNLVESAIDYVEGSSNRLSRNFGKKLADKLYREGVDKMSTDMKIFSRDFIDSAFNTGSIGFRNISKVLYTWNLALNVKWLAMNGTQPLARTYPVMARYLGTGEAEKSFLKSYDVAGRYLKYLGGGGKQGISSDLLYSLNKLHNQGVLGDQATRLMMGVRSVKGEQLEKIIGSFGRFGEFINRSHAAAAGYYIGTEKLGLEGKSLVEFMRQFVYKTQVAYGKHNLPLAITRAGDWASFLKMVYTFQHYNLDNLQYINSTMPWHKGAKAGETTRALGALLAVGGIKGLPLLGTGMALYALWKKMRKEGGSADYDMRKMMTSKNVPPGVQDALLNGIPVVGGMDMSASTRPDLPFVSPQGTVNPGGVPAGMADRIWQTGMLLKQGEIGRAMEKGSPRFAENIQKAIRFHNEGVTTKEGQVLLEKEKVGWWDTALVGMGFTPTTITKMYEGENVKSSFTKAHSDAVSEFNLRMAKAIHSRDDAERRQVMQDVREFNAKASTEQRVVLDYTSIYTKVKQMEGRSTGVPIGLRRKFKELEEVYK